ncbi:MAG: hypothetical protein SFV55_02860 [Haliscomenobacter sp.]|uniref:hypothetical protein n=1 Tax=Haliscomenobacter sp. TaxID=2717303 RepID=UPI0029B1C161|nr:hypothetical protein [Haliscomenobacter sp.]MDX2067336.1 hypothetical protein [Haliscomenobacter sp.]
MNAKFSIYISLIVFCNLSTNLVTIAQSAATLLASAKAEFKKEYATQNMTQAAQQLQQALLSQPNNPEIHYYLANALDRVNAAEATWVASSNRKTVAQISQHLEQCIRLSPRYKGEKLALDPYSKLGSVWGGLAMGYLAQNLPDSARWAFRQGKSKGAYLEPSLELGRNLLNSCTKDAILFSSGDNFSYPLFYLQTVENLRLDVQIVDVNLLNTDWYCLYLAAYASNATLREGVSIDAIPNLVSWKPGPVSAKISSSDCGNDKTFEWDIPELINGDFLLRSEYVLLQVIIGNQFASDIFFTAGFSKDDLLYLDSHLEFGVLVQKLKPCDAQKTKNAADYLRNFNLSSLPQQQAAINNSPDLVNQLNFYRIGYANAIFQLIELGKTDDAKALMAALETRLPTTLVPMFSATLNDYIEKLKVSLNR